MYHPLIFACVIILCSIVPCVLCKGSVDRTLEPGAIGSAVVHACIDKISNTAIGFSSSDQKFMLRRIAYVETRDGLDYSNSTNDGGIWQLSFSKYQETKSTSATQLLDKIKAEFQITWANTTLSDLRKPLYSALAARLYLEIIPHSIPLATNISGQGNYWVKYYTSSGGTESDRYENAVNDLNEKEVCEVRGLDLIFIMDSSGSVRLVNFEKMKTFVNNTVNAFDVGPNSVRVGVMSYSNYYTFHFHLNTYSSKSSVLSAINNIQYSGGLTYTASAINAARTIGFTDANGARPPIQGIPRVAIVITDGKSNSLSATTSAAAAMHNAGIIGFAIGIVGADINELNKIASKPSYVAFLSSFNTDLLSNLQLTLSQETCEVSVDIPPDVNVTDTIPEGEIKYVNYPLPPDYSGITLQVNVSSGTCVVYGSTVISTPSNALYDVKLTTDGWKDVYIDQDNFTDSTTADKLYLAIKSDVNVNCTVTLSIDKGDTSTDPVSVVLYPNSTDVFQYFGSELTASCYVTGKPLPVVNWYKDDVILNSTTEQNDLFLIETTSENYNVTSILTIAHLSKDHEGAYKCIGSNTVPNGPVTDIKSFNITVQVEVSNLNGTAINSTAIYLSWEVNFKYGIEVEYFVVKCDELDTDRNRSLSAIEPESHAHITSLHPYRSYSCAVRIVEKGYAHPFNTPINIVTHQARPSDPPSNLSSKFIGEEEKILAWNFSWVPLSSENINGVLLGYEVVCTDLDMLTVNATISGTSVVLSEFKAETHYICTVCAYTVVGCGPSASTQLITYEDSDISPPLSLHVASTSAATITLQWDPPFNPKNVIIIGYKITYWFHHAPLFPSLGLPRPSVTESSVSTEHTISSLLVGTEYLIEVHALYGQDIPGPVTKKIEAKTKKEDDYSVRNYHCYSPSPLNLSCLWENPNPSIGFQVKEYQLTYRLAPGFNYYPQYGMEFELDRIRFDQLRNSFLFTITKLQPFCGYIIEVKCFAQLTVGKNVSDIVSISSVYQYTQQSDTTGKVQNINIEIISPTSVEVTLTPPPRHTWNGPISYVITAEGIQVPHRDTPGNRGKRSSVRDVKVFNLLPQANNGDPSLATEPLQTESYVLENLEENFEYSFYIAVVNGKGAGTPADPIDVITAESAPSGPPTNIMATNITSSSLTIIWEPPNPFDANGVIQLYSVNFTRSGEQATILRSNDSLVFKQQGMNPNESITVAIAAKTAVGWGPYSRPYIFTTLAERQTTPGASSSSRIGGSLGGVLVIIIIVAISVVLVVAYFMKCRSRKEKRITGEMYYRVTNVMSLERRRSSCDSPKSFDIASSQNNQIDNSTSSPAPGVGQANEYETVSFNEKLNNSTK